MTSVSSAPSPPAGSISSGLRQAPSLSVAGSVNNISGSPAAALASPVSANDLKQFKAQMQKLHQNQLSKITFKSEADIEFLETLKEYMQKRSELEMQHAKNVEKLSKSFSTKKFRKYLGASNAPLFSPNIGVAGSGEKSVSEKDGTGGPAENEIKSSGSNHPPGLTTTSRQVYKSFMTLLEQSEVQAKKRIVMGEAIEESIAKVLKEFYKLKASLTKKNIEFGVKYQQEIWNACDELERTRALYDKAAKDADAAHKKFQDSLMKPKGLSALKNIVTGKDAASVSEQLNNKHKAKVKVLHNARNHYILALAGINTLQKLYDQDDLPQLMTKVDGFFYDVLASVIGKFSDYETILSNQVVESSELVRDEAELVSRESDLAQFLEQYAAIFKPSTTFNFEGVGQDELKEIVADEFSKVDLGRKLGELMVQDNTLVLIQETKEKELKGAEQLVEISNNGAPSSSGNATVSPLELKQDIQNSLDLIKCQRTKIIHQMKMIKSFNVPPIMPENTEMTPPSGKQTARVIHSHKGTAETDASLLEGDEVEIVSDASTANDPEGYTTVKTKDGKRATLPTTSLELISKPPPKSIAESRIVVAVYDYKANEEGELSFTAGDEIECDARVNVDDEYWQGKVLATGHLGIFPKLLTKGWESVAATASKDFASLARVASLSTKRPQSLLVVQKKNRERRASDAVRSNSSPVDKVVAVGGTGTVAPPVTAQSSSIDNNAAALDPLLNGLLTKMAKVGEMKEEEEEDEDEEEEQVKFQAIALYDYEATCAGELSIHAGELIINISKDTGSDQWWSGSGKNGTGQFPASYVSIKKQGSGSGGVVVEEDDLVVVKRVRGLYDFTPASPGELGFKAGDVLVLRQSDDADWWDGELNGQVGAFPAAYVEKIYF